VILLMVSKTLMDNQVKVRPERGEGNKELEVELSVEELAQILGEELELPKIEPKGKKTIQSQVDKLFHNW
jgi:uncharacterized sporulation protein YeaH/YhbH (DUF444 family)